MSQQTKTKHTDKNQARRAAPALGKRGRLALPMFIAVALVACILGSVLLFQLPAADNAPAGPMPTAHTRATLATNNTPPTPKPKTAAIVDQLSLTFPNPDFAQTATSLLEQADYSVDYFPGKQVTVDFFRNLAASDYDLVILRVHSALVIKVNKNKDHETPTQYVGLFTGEPYDETKYSKQANHLGPAHYYEGAPLLFGIAPDYITHDMRDRFKDTLIIMMGCGGLWSETTAQAFLDKGARAYVGWDWQVSASHTDAATLYLLEQFLIEGLPVDKAVAQTMSEVGPDPAYGAELQVLFAAE